MNTDFNHRGFVIGRNPFKPLSYRVLFKGVWLIGTAPTQDEARRLIDRYTANGGGNV